MHKLLERQLRRYFEVAPPETPELRRFLEAVDAAYTENDADRLLLERSIELTSGELIERNERLEFELAAVHRLELELRQAEKLRAVGQLAAGVAHEINTPIQYVGDNIQFMREACEAFSRLGSELKRLLAASGGSDDSLRPLAEAAEELDLEYMLEHLPSAVEHASDGVRRVAEIVLAMKNFGHPDVRDKVPSNVNRCLENTLLVATNELKYVADVVVSLGELPEVPCFPGDLGQVFLALLVNAAQAVAARFGPAGRGRVEVTTRAGAADVEVSIADNGTGIALAHQARVFEPFFTTKPVGVGTGQGLAIARSIVVEKHGGSLWFESTEGVGTVFHVKLPLEETRAGVASSRRFHGQAAQ